MAQTKKAKVKAKAKPAKKASKKAVPVKKTVKAKPKAVAAKPTKKTAAVKKTARPKAAKAPIKKRVVTKSAAKKATIKKSATPKAAVSKPSKTTKIAKPSSPKGKTWLQPLDDRILVEVAEQDQVSPGGIVLIDSSTQPDNVQGFVVAVGRGHQNKKGRIRPIELKAGDKIIFSKYAGDKVSQDGVNFVIIRETEVLGFASN